MRSRLARSSTVLVTSLALVAGLASLHAGCGGGGGGGSRGAPNPSGTGAIGPQGGSVQVIGGALDGTSLTVPAGALTQTATFALVTGTDTTADTGFTPAGTAVKVTPDGQTFGTPATLVLRYDPALLPAGKSASDIRVLKRDDATGQLTLLTPSSTTSTTVTVQLSSLSTFQPAVFVGGAPTITATSSPIGGTPPAVNVTGGETVTITGANLFRGSTVSWNGLQLAPADVTFAAGSGSLQAKTPAGGVGTTVTVVVTQLSGVAVTGTNAFVYRELLLVTGQTPASNARLGPTETAFVTVSSDVDPATLAAGTAAVFSSASIAATATGSIALATSRTIALRPTQPIPVDGQLALSIDADLRSSAGVAATPQTVSFSTAPTTDLGLSSLIQHSSSPAVTLRDGRVLVIGGKGPLQAIKSCYLVDPAAGTVVAAANLNTARLGAMAVLLADGKVGVFGGQDGNTMVTSVEVYDPAIDSWTLRPYATVPRGVQHSVVPIAGGRWLAAGGYPQANLVSTPPAQQTLEVFDATLSTCTAQVVTSLLAGPAVALPNGDVLLVGNRLATIGTAEGQVLTIDPAAATDAARVSAAPIFSGALAGGAASDPSAARFRDDDRVLVHRATFNNVVRVNYAGSTPTGFTALAGTPLQAARTRTATRLVTLPDGSILIGPGGFNTSITNPVADLYVPGAIGSPGSVLPLTLRTGRRSYTLALLRDGRAGIFGGRTGTLSAGPEVDTYELVTPEAGSQASLSGASLVALASNPTTGFPIRPSDTTVRFTLSGALDPATVLATSVSVTVNLAPVSASVALVDRRVLVVTLAPSVTLAPGNVLTVSLLAAIRDTEGRPLDTARGVASITCTVGP